MNQYNGVLSRSCSDPQLSEAYLPNLYETSHAANLLQLDNGDILCAWFSGSGEGNPDTNVVLSRLNAGTHQWTAPIDLSSDPEHSEQNPVLFQAPDGSVWLLYTSNLPHKQETSRIYIKTSEDRGLTWGAAEMLFHDEGIFLRHPIVVLSNGDWILPIYYCRPEGHFSGVKISKDNGMSWKEYGVAKSRQRV